MNSKDGFWHWFILAVLAGLSVWLVTSNPINLGIDLAGGFSFTLQVDEETRFLVHLKGETETTGQVDTEVNRVGRHQPHR